MRVRLALIVSVFVLSLASCSQASESSLERRIQRVERGLLSAYRDPPWKRMDLAERMAYHNVPGVSIAVINDHQVEWTRGYGVLEAGKNEPVTPQTIFQTGSIAKLVVAVIALQYVERGALELDSDVNQSLVSWQVPENEFTLEEKVTLRRLLSHSAGVTVGGFRGYALGEQVPDLQQILNGEWPANSPPIRVDTVPGTLHRYSGGGYMIVQQLLEDVTGEYFPDITRESVLEPWGMTDSTFESPLPERLRLIAASGHRADGSTIPGGWHTYPEMGAGASAWSTSSDLARFAIRVMQSYAGQSDSVLSSSMTIQMLTTQIDKLGLGPELYDDGGDLFYFAHPGANDGYASILIAYPKRGQGVVILTNGDNGRTLWREIVKSVSIEYGWVKDYTILYTSITIAIVLAVAGILILRRARAHSSSGFDDPKRLVEQGYDRVAHDYARLEGETKWPRMRWLRKMLNELDPGSSVLDLGCGAGDPADVEIAREHRVTGVDISQAQIELARRNVPAGNFIHGDAASVEFPAASFDAVVSFYALEHIPREEHKTIFRRIHQWLRPRGFLLLSTEAGDVAGVVDQWLNVPMYFSSFDPETVKRLVNQTGFEIVETEIESQSEQGAEIPYLWLAARS